MSARVLAFPVRSNDVTTAPAVVTRERGETAAAHVDVILRTSAKGIKPIPNARSLGMTETSKAIRDLFRSLGWGKFFRVTKGSWSLGTDIEWAKGHKPDWFCPRIMELRRKRGEGAWFEIPHCGCTTCCHREKQRMAVGRRVHAVLNAALGGEREFGDRSDIMTDYFDADYTFHP